MATRKGLRLARRDSPECVGTGLHDLRVLLVEAQQQDAVDALLQVEVVVRRVVGPLPQARRRLRAARGGGGA